MSSYQQYLSNFAIETHTWSTMLRFEFANMQLDQIYLISESCEVLFYDKKKSLQTFRAKTKASTYTMRRTNVLTYPWAKIEDNLVTKHANCGSQGSPIYKTSYTKL